MSRGKQKFLHRSAMTLTELLIASALVGIVTLGLVAAEYTIRTSRQSSSRDSLISAQLQSTMLQLSHDVSLTVGDAGNTGIEETPPGGGNSADKTACFREASGEPNTYTDDLWNCWWYDSATLELSSCRGLSDPPPTTCNLQASKKIWTKLTSRDFYTIVYNGSQINYIQLDLVSLYDVTKAENAISNPSYHLFSVINPAGLSR